MSSESPNIQKESPERVPSIPLSEFSKLPRVEQNEIVDNTLNELRDSLQSYGFSESKDITSMYNELPKEELIVRREDPDAIFDLLEGGTRKISFDVDETEYANSVAWNPSDGSKHIQNAYYEGYGQKNSVVAVVGIRKGEDLILKKLEDSQKNFHGLDRSGVRSLQGEIVLDDVAFISLRIPIQYMQESDLTEDEIDNKFEYEQSLSGGQRIEPLFVHRGYMRKNSNL